MTASKKCACSFFKKRGDYSHLPNCSVAQASEGFMLSLSTLSAMVARLQGNIVVPNQRNFDMWHQIFDVIDDSIIVVNGSGADFDRTHEGPALYHFFKFDPIAVQDMFDHPGWDGEGIPGRC